MNIRRVEFNDLDWLRKERNNPDIYRYFNQYRELTREEQENWYFRLPQSFHPFIVWNGNEHIGYVALRDIDNIVRKAEFSIFILDAYRNNGHGEKAMELILDYGFNVLNLNKIYSVVFMFNRAIEFYKRIGFVIDGVLRDDCYKEGGYWDSYQISMLRGDYEKIYHSKQ